MTSSSSSSNTVVFKTSAASSDSAEASSSAASSGRQAFELEQERSLPGVMMAEDGKIFKILYQLAETEDPGTIAGVKRLIHLIPTGKYYLLIVQLM